MGNNVITKITEAQQREAQQRKALERLEKFSHFTDSSIGIPFTKFRLGADSVIGMLPVGGDIAGLLLSSYVLVEAQRIGASKEVKRQILRNMVIDFAGGLLPVVGDVFDAIFKANTRNTHLLKNHLEGQLAVAPPPAPFPWKTLVVLSILLALITAGAMLLF